MYIYIYIYSFIYKRISDTYICIHTHASVRIFIHIYLTICIYIFIYFCISIFIYIWIWQGPRKAAPKRDPRWTNRRSRGQRQAEALADRLAGDVHEARARNFGACEMGRRVWTEMYEVRIYVHLFSHFSHISGIVSMVRTEPCDCIQLNVSQLNEASSMCRGRLVDLFSRASPPHPSQKSANQATAAAQGQTPSHVSQVLRGNKAMGSANALRQVRVFLWAKRPSQT